MRKGVAGGNKKRRGGMRLRGVVKGKQEREGKEGRKDGWMNGW